jgi:hypothetical protein
MSRGGNRQEVLAAIPQSAKSAPIGSHLHNVSMPLDLSTSKPSFVSSHIEKCKWRIASGCWRAIVSVVPNGIAEQATRMPQPMANYIIAVLPRDGDSALVLESLRGQDLELEVARSTEAALKVLAATAASVIVYDADTGQPWRDAVRCFLAARPGVRVVLLSQSVDARMWWDLFDCGAFDVIIRPFRPLDFRAIIRSALNPPQFFSAVETTAPAAEERQEVA